MDPTTTATQVLSRWPLPPLHYKDIETVVRDPPKVPPVDVLTDLAAFGQQLHDVSIGFFVVVLLLLLLLLLLLCCCC